MSEPDVGLRIKLGWTQKDRDEVRVFHRELLNQLKREWGHNHSDNIEWLPGFREGVESLLEQGYCMDDVSAFIGLSRERVRQLVARWGLDPMAYRRTWPRQFDSELGRFVPSPPVDWRKEARAITRTRREDRRGQEAHRRWLRARTALNAFVAEYGRVPNAAELGRALNLRVSNHTAAIRHWLGNPKALDRLYLECGYFRPPYSRHRVTNAAPLAGDTE